LSNTKHTLVALVEDKPGVLNRVSSLLRRRNFNIDSIAVGHTEQPHLSRMTIIVDGDDARVEQARKQLDKVIEVVKIVDITGLSRAGAGQSKGNCLNSQRNHSDS
jgi:acetolactate synthase-1/3 small subunit